MLAWTLKPIRLKKGVKLIGYRSQILKQMLTLEILNRMSIVKQIDSQKRIERTIQTLKPAMQLRHKKLKPIHLWRQKLELMNLIDLLRLILVPTSLIGWQKLILVLATLIDWLKSALGPTTLIDSLKSTLELATLTGWQIQIPELANRID